MDEAPDDAGWTQAVNLAALNRAVVALEKRVAALEVQPRPTGPAEPRLLRGWAQIERYLGLTEKTLQKYRQNEGLPIMRWGRSVVIVPESVGTWLMAREPRQVARRAARRIPQQGKGIGRL
jgi:hypothetical protein